MTGRSFRLFYVLKGLDAKRRVEVVKDAERAWMAG